MQSRILGRGVSKRTLLTSLAFGLVACSGGGGGGSSPPSPPAPPPNNAPAPVVAVDDLSPEEGQPFIIDASGSTDADGDALTITIAQRSGPEAGISPNTGSYPDAAGVRRFTAPLVDLDSVMVFDITLSDGRATSVETVDVSVSNVILEPATELLESYDLNIPVPEGARGLMQANYFGTQPRYAITGLAAAPGESLSFFHLRRSPDEFEQIGMDIALAGSAEAQRVFFDLGRFNSGGLGGAFSLELDNTIATLEPTFNEPEGFRLGVEIPANAPCAIQSGTVFREPGAPGDDIFVAERGAGLHYRLSTEDPDNLIGYEDKESIIDTGSYCEFEIADLDGRGFPVDLVAIDVDGLSFATFAEFLGGNYLQIESEPLNFTSDADLSVFGFGSTVTGERKFFVVGLTDGQDVGGDHRILVYRALNEPDPAASEIVSFGFSQELRWSDGAPVDLKLQRVGGDTSIIAIAVPTSPSLRLYEGVDPNSPTGVPEFGTATFLDVGAPVNSVHAFGLEDTDRLGLMVLIGEQNRIRTYVASDPTDVAVEKSSREDGQSDRAPKLVEPSLPK